MKPRPTREQNKYLSIVLNTPEENLPRPLDEDPIISPAVAVKDSTPVTPASKSVRPARPPAGRRSEFPVPVVIILIVIALLLALIRGVHSEEALPVISTNLVPVTVKSNSSIPSLNSSLVTKVATKSLPVVKTPVSAKKRNTTAVKPLTPYKREKSTDLKTVIPLASSNNLNFIHDIPFLSNSPASLFDPAIEVQKSDFHRKYDSSNDEDTYIWAICLIIIIIGLIVGSWLLGSLYIHKRKCLRVKKEEKKEILSPKNIEKTSVPVKSVEKIIIPVPDKPEVKYENPEQVLRDIISNEKLSATPLASLPAKFWDVAVATHKGNIRASNEDSGMAFTCLGVQFLIIADGMGGMKHGGIASNSAVSEAIRSIVSDMTFFRAWHRPDVLAIIEKAIYRAAIRLSEEAAKLNLSHPQMGLRTTLIIIAGGIDFFAYVYIGDGGGIILRSDGSNEQFLDPQKADARYSNILAASLGPHIEGKPRSGTADRFPSDLLITGSDGVFDYVVPEFSLEVARKVFELNGNLKDVAENIVEILAGEKDEKGWLCSDNITFGLMANAPISPLMFTAANNISASTTADKKISNIKEA